MNTKPTRTGESRGGASFPPAMLRPRKRRLTVISVIRSQAQSQKSECLVL
jgi:hypothetical protein